MSNIHTYNYTCLVKFFVLLKSGIDDDYFLDSLLNEPFVAKHISAGHCLTLDLYSSSTSRLVFILSIEKCVKSCQQQLKMI